MEELWKNVQLAYLNIIIKILRKLLTMKSDYLPEKFSIAKDYVLQGNSLAAKMCNCAYFGLTLT